MPARELGALRTQNVHAANIITKRPLDILLADSISEKLDPTRILKFIIQVRDPRSLLCSRHRSIPHQCFQSWDYQFFIDRRKGTKSFTNPGMSKIFEASQELRDSHPGSLILKYENLVADPQAVRQFLSDELAIDLSEDFAEFHTKDVPERLQWALNGLRRVEAEDRPPWVEPKNRGRLLHQLDLFPEIETAARALGYPPVDEVLNRYGDQEDDNDIPDCRDVGTVIAFHTDDDVYTHEARRLIASLKRTDVPFDVTVMPSNGDWVANCALKSRFLLEKRKQLRGPLLYVDVDAVFHRSPWPYLKGYDGDVAVYIERNGVLASGTILINDTTPALKLLSAWVAEQERRPQDWDQWVLKDIVQESEARSDGEHRVQRLPPNMIHIFDRQYHSFYGPVYIEQLQASRQSKATKDTPNLRRRRDRVAEIERDLQMG